MNITATLPEGAVDILVHLVDHGPAHWREIAKALDRQHVYGGGLNVLRGVGLIDGPNDRGGWWATAEGRQAVERARAEVSA